MPLDFALTRAAGSFGPATLDRTARTVQATALSGLAPAVRPGPAPDGAPSPWIEELVASGADLGALRSAPVLVDHRPRVDAAVGAVASAEVTGDQIKVSLRFDGSPEADAVLVKVEAGSVRGVSLGYRVSRWQRAGDRNGLPVFRAITWAPFEISLVPCPVDPGATLRSHLMEGQTGAEGANGGTGGTGTGSTIINDPAADATRTRAQTNAAIRSVAEIAGLDRTWADSQIDAGRSADEARAAAFAEMQTRRQRSAGGATIDNRAPALSITSGYSADDPATMRRSMADALAHRLAPGAVKLEGAAVQFRSLPALAMFGRLAAARGERLDPWDRESLLTRALGAHSASDFPALLSDAANKSLLAQYQAAAPTYRSIAARKSFNDFKAHKFLRLGDFPNFAEVAENGPVTYGTLSENKEEVTAGEFATGIAIGRRALLNDDLSALSDFSSLIAVRAAAFENAKVYGLLAGNGPTLSDGDALFHANHGNKAAAGTTIDVANVGAAVAALRKMTGLDGVPLNIRPRFLVVGPDRELLARQVLAAVTPAQASNVNPWSGAFELIVDSNISGNRWLMFADPAQIPTLVYGYVNGAEGPQISTETDFDNKAVKVRAGLDFGCGAIDFRGAYSNAGN